MVNPIPQPTPDFPVRPKVNLRGITIMRIGALVAGVSIALCLGIYVLGSALMMAAGLACR